jgi:hypothetical protein
LSVLAKGTYFDGAVIDKKFKCEIPLTLNEKKVKYNSSKVKVSKIRWGTGGVKKDGIKSEHVARVSNISKAMSNKIHRTGACS